MNRWALDTEFLEDGKTIELISIALVSLDSDAEYYAGNRSMDAGRVLADPWLKKHVVPHLPPIEPGFWKTPQEIGKDLRHLFGLTHAGASLGTPEIWADHASYDWVALCQIYGRMIDLPRGMPMFCMDLQQRVTELGLRRRELPDQEPQTMHHALEDARWLKRALAYVDTLRP